MEFLDYLTIKLAGVSTWKRDRDMLILLVLILILRNYEVFPFIPLVLLNKIYTTINIIPKNQQTVQIFW